MSLHHQAPVYAAALAQSSCLASCNLGRRALFDGER